MEKFSGDFFVALFDFTGSVNPSEDIFIPKNKKLVPNTSGYYPFLKAIETMSF